MTAAMIHYLFLTHRAKQMTDAEKAAAFDLLVQALTNQWHDGKWSAHCGSMVDQTNRDTQAECIPDLLEWAERVAKIKAKRREPA